MSSISSARKLLAVCFVLIFITCKLFPGEACAITAKEEEDLSREFMKIARKQYQFIEDPCIVDGVSRVGNKIVAVLPPQPFTYHFYVILDDAYNAFAAPAGHIFINSGLLQAMDREEELAGILGHEIAHVACRHISHNIERSKKIQMTSLAGLAAGILFGIAGAGEVGSAVMTGTRAAGQSVSLAHSREDEAQADQLGLTLCTKAGYGADGLLEMLNKIREKDWFGQDVPTYLKTHPATEKRIAYIGAWIDQYQRKGKKNNLSDTYEFQRMRTKLIATYGDRDIALDTFKRALADDPQDAMTRYGYALVLERSNDIEKAIEHLKVATEKRPLDPFIQADLGRMYYLGERYMASIDILENYIDLYPKDQKLRFYFACAQMKVGKLDEAAANFKRLLKKENPQNREVESRDKNATRQRGLKTREIQKKHPESTLALYYLAKIYHQQGRKGDTHFYLGMYHCENRNVKSARFHLETALDLIKEPAKRKKIRGLLADLNSKGDFSPKKARARSGGGRRR
jgi:predicted Zn-dependent protease